MAAPRRLLLSFAAVALAMVALVSASGYDGEQGDQQATATHRMVRVPTAAVATTPALVQRASLPNSERRLPRQTGFVLLAAITAAVAAAVSRAPERLHDQVAGWRTTVCGRRGPPAPACA